MEVDIDWFEGYFEAKTKEEKIEWLKTTNLKYDNSYGSFTPRARQFYSIVVQKLKELER